MMSASIAGPRESAAAPALLMLVVTVSGVLGLVLASVGLRFGPGGPVALLLAAALVWVALARPHVLVSVLALALPLGALTVGPLELVQLVLILVVLGALAQAGLRGDLVLPPWQISVPLAGMLLAAALATSAARDADAAFRLDVRLLFEVLLVVAMVTVLRSARHVDQVVNALLLAGGAISGWALVTSGEATAYLDGAVLADRASGPFAQPNELGLLAAALLVLAVGVGITTTRPTTRLLCVASGGLLLAALAESFSRGAWIGAAAGLVALAVLSPPSRRALALVCVLGAGTGGLLATLGSSLSAAVATRLASIPEASGNPYDERTLIWAESLRQLQDRPLTGQGPGSFSAAAQSAAAESAAGGARLEAEHGHHLFLTVAAEYGLLGLTALLALIAGLIAITTGRRAWATTPPGRGRSLLPVLVSALVAVTVHGLLDYPLRNAVGSTTVWLLVGLLVAEHSHLARRVGPVHPGAGTTTEDRSR
ncbi:O-antigen ligase family protein [Nocardioides donggukensis]|uniref:O-antigen ligase family protein n=1 Tax=Nocardioides donggukensis TaxID=2774019 RepID=A0A927K5Q6_9ACTN|nr:O-antigen ligase family protein [Nocardioides donggukensis]MBD8869498.1 O-antigen ligase family protein [Nocardioides donggukensis]